MAEQETLDGTGTPAERPAFDPAQHGLWARFKNSDHTINHAAWLRACAEHGFVGTCRQCGAYLVPVRPEELGRRTDYEAHCQADGCGWILNAPGGRYLGGRSARRSDQPSRTR